MKFTIGFEKEDLKTVQGYWNQIIETSQWSESVFIHQFEEKWSVYHQLGSAAFNGWTGAALCALDHFNLRGKTILCPSNTFMATVNANLFLGCQVEFVDCNKEDLCISFEDLKRKVEKYNPAAVWVVHIGGHIAFEIEKIAKYCKEKNIILLEDCAHAHGAQWNGKRPGSWGDAGVYSFYATKTISTGEGGMLVSKHADLIKHAQAFRNYGKPDYSVLGVNFRMSEFTAALGCVQIDRMDEIVQYKAGYAADVLDKKYDKRVYFPDGMTSGFYKYIVFEEIEKSTGKVYEESCHKILKRDCDLPNTDWVAKNHWCVPLYYKGVDNYEFKFEGEKAVL